MKKKFWKKYAAVTLTAVMAAAALTGCGGDKKRGNRRLPAGQRRDFRGWKDVSDRCFPVYPACGS